MKYLVAVLSLVIGCSVGGPYLWFSHELPVLPAVFSGACIAFAFYLFDPTEFLAFWAEVRKNVVCWFKKGSDT